MKTFDGEDEGIDSIGILAGDEMLSVFELSEGGTENLSILKKETEESYEIVTSP